MQRVRLPALWQLFLSAHNREIHVGLFKSLFRKSDVNPYAGLSAADIEKKIAECNRQIEQLKRKLPSATALEGREKSVAWMADMQEKLKSAKSRGQLDEMTKIEGDIRESSKRAERINKHVDEIKGHILRQEDEIESLSHALSSAK